MSRVGKYPVEIPAGVQVAIAGRQYLTAKGKLGELKLALTDKVEATVEGNKVSVAPKTKEAQARMMWGTTRANIANMVKGVSTGYTKSLEITGTGYRAAVQGKNLVINLGFSHDVVYPIPEGIKITCERRRRSRSKGVDKRQVGQVAPKSARSVRRSPTRARACAIRPRAIRRKEGKKK
jgi:large subunit ribosomal protein L6